MSKYDKTYYQKNKKRLLAQQKKYRDKPETQEKHAKRDAARWASLSPEEKLRRKKMQDEWRAAHPERIAEYVRKRREERNRAKAA